MKCLLLFLVLLLAAKTVVSQNTLAVPQPDSLPVFQAAPDTAAAIHRLFADRRKTSHLLTGMIVGATAIAFVGDTRPFSVVAAELPLVVVLVAPFEILILLTHKKYSKKAEVRALRTLQTHQLSPKIKRRLKAHHFQPVPGRK